MPATRAFLDELREPPRPPLPREELPTPTPPNGVLRVSDGEHLAAHAARVAIAQIIPELDRREKAADERLKSALAAQTAHVETTMRESVAAARKQGAEAAERRDERIARIEARVAPGGLVGALTSPKAVTVARAVLTLLAGAVAAYLGAK